MITFMCQFWQIDTNSCYLEQPQLVTFQRKIDDIFKKLPNVFGTAEEILGAYYDDDGTVHNNTLRSVLLIC